MPYTPCLDCGAVFEKSPGRRSRCERCEAARQSGREKARAPRRGTTAQRGYGAEHRRERTEWAPLVAQGLVTCWRCGHPISPSTPWDLDHGLAKAGGYAGPTHSECNRRHVLPEAIRQRIEREECALCRASTHGICLDHDETDA